MCFTTSFTTPGGDSYCKQALPCVAYATANYTTGTSANSPGHLQSAGPDGEPWQRCTFFGSRFRRLVLGCGFYHIPHAFFYYK